MVIERILGFSLSSPLAKFLNGLEILLSKSQVRTRITKHGSRSNTKQSSTHTHTLFGVIFISYFLSLFQDWENNASRSVSLRNELEPITQLIIQWRKLELKYVENFFFFFLFLSDDLELICSLDHLL